MYHVHTLNSPSSFRVCFVGLQYTQQHCGRICETLGIYPHACPPAPVVPERLSSLVTPLSPSVSAPPSGQGSFDPLLKTWLLPSSERTMFPWGGGTRKVGPQNQRCREERGLGKVDPRGNRRPLGLVVIYSGSFRAKCSSNQDYTEISTHQIWKD